MHRTIFKTPVINSILYGLSSIVLKATGWRLVGNKPELKKYVLIAAPHTSNWDFPLAMFIVFYSRNDIYWLGKSELFRFPFGGLFKWLGGIPVDRSRSNNLVSAVIDEYKKNDSLIVGLSPAGSRSNFGSWKTGFYHIANGAGVPISLAYLDYKTKTVGYGRMFYPTGDIDSDMQEITGFYSDKRGKNQK